MFTERVLHRGATPTMTVYNLRAFTPQRAAIQLATARLARPFFSVVCRPQVSGLENIPKTGALVVAPNHLSMIDPPLLAAVLDRPLAYMAKRELFENPLVGALISFFCAFSVNRQHPEVSTFKIVKRLIKQGWAIVMFPEGTRNRRPGRLLPPHLGPAYFAFAHGVPILPIGIAGTDKPFNKARIRIGKLIEPSPDLEATTWQIMEALSELTGFDMPERQISVWMAAAIRQQQEQAERGRKQ